MGLFQGHLNNCTSLDIFRSTDLKAFVIVSNNFFAWISIVNLCLFFVMKNFEFKFLYWFFL
jgi:hypothetical protein